MREITGSPDSISIVLSSLRETIGCTDSLIDCAQADAVPGFGYAFFADQTGCCQDEAAAEGDLIVRDPSWTPREFEAL